MAFAMAPLAAAHSFTLDQSVIPGQMVSALNSLPTFAGGAVMAT